MAVVGLWHESCSLCWLILLCWSSSNNQVWLQEFNPNALAKLMDTSAQLRSTHLDMQFMRRRRQKNPFGASRQWFVNADLWLAGTAAASEGGKQHDNQSQVNKVCSIITVLSSSSVKLVDEFEQLHYICRNLKRRRRWLAFLWMMNSHAAHFQAKSLRNFGMTTFRYLT